MDDKTKPAFMQPPIPGALLKSGKDADKHTVLTPDDLDILITSKRHGLKSGQISAASVEHWILALISLQTHAPYGGSKSYGCSRQNGGFASRAGVSVVPGLAPGAAWARDVRIILENADHPYAIGMSFDYLNGKKLLWLYAWNGQDQYIMNDLHHLYIEISRIIRLRIKKTASVYAMYIPTDTYRINPGENKDKLCGNVGDPWIPIGLTGKDAPKALNVKPDYQSVSRVLFDRREYRPALLQEMHRPDGSSGLAVRFRFLVRGNCVTEGYFERLIPIHKNAYISQQAELASETAHNMIELARQAEKGLRRAVLLLMQPKSKDQPDDKQKETAAWAKTYADRLDRIVDENFFPILWDCLDERESGLSPLESLKPWHSLLESASRKLFEEAVAALPGSGTRSFLAIARGEALLNKMLNDLPTPAKKGGNKGERRPAKSSKA